MNNSHMHGLRLYRAKKKQQVEFSHATTMVEIRTKLVDMRTTMVYMKMFVLWLSSTVRQ